MHDDVGAGDELADAGLVADVPAQFVDGALELRVVERRGIERADVVAGLEKPPREVKAEKTRAAGDRPQHPADSTGRSRATASKWVPVMRRTLCLLVLLVLAFPAAASAVRVNPQVAGLQVALRA